ncbi:MAG: TrkA family potassium uptake protein [Thermoleophilia bacterium]|nr:TrkA family potassium uptake protein [Thermoleophilia bacterium]
MSKQFVVIGLGRFGSSVALTLSQLGEEVLGMDLDEDRVQALSEKLLHVVAADATDPAVLESVGVRNFDVAVVSIGERLQDSILITLALKEAGIPRVVAKAVNDIHGRVLIKVGADRVFYPERDMGVRAAHSLVGSNIIDYIEFGADYSIMEINAPERFYGKSLANLALRAQYGITVLAIKKGTSLQTAPRAEDLVEPGSVLVVMGHNNDLRKFTQ